MGYFNAKIGAQQKSDASVGKYGYGNRNECGHRLVEFAEWENFHIMNSFFMKNPNRKWTWNGSSGIMNEMDYIPTNKKHVIEDCIVVNYFDTRSDNQLVRCKLYLNATLEETRFQKKTKTINITILKNKRNKVELELKNRFSLLQMLGTTLTTIMKIVERAPPKKLEESKGINQNKNISDETKQLMRRRQEMKQFQDTNTN
ncbi:hypothetical protein FKM82_027069 [Ascaphus truei]